MSFNPDSTKQAEEVVSFFKKNLSILLSLFFNNLKFEQTEAQTYLGLNLDQILTFQHNTMQIKNKGTYKGSCSP